MSITFWLEASSLSVFKEGVVVSGAVCSEVRFGGVASRITLGEGVL